MNVTTSASASTTARGTPAAPIAWNKESILFSACQEDSRSELAAFGSLEGKRVFAVTAGGGRVLNLLIDKPRSITAVDLNPAQNALLELKIAAVRGLDHGAYLRFLGIRPADDRVATYERHLRDQLSFGARRFFDGIPKAIGAGILFQGKMEKYLRVGAKVLKLGHPFGLKNLLDARNLDEQRAAMARWETPFWKGVAHLVGNKHIIARLSGDPGFYRNLPPKPPLHEVLYDRVHRHLKHNLLRENSFLQLVLHGRYVYEDVLPIYLNANTFETIKAALAETAIDIQTTTVTDALAASSTGFDAFSISDICSYLDPEPNHRLFELVLSAAKPGARLCSRSNIFHRPLAPEHAARVNREPELEARLSLHDHATVHEFVVGEIRPAAS
jgi:S-adenosylmethionine-diacylglycerol 3-amino-3-carboxypropyl transferase